MSEVELPEVKEKSGGRFVISGSINNPEAIEKPKRPADDDLILETPVKPVETVKPVSTAITLDLRTQRGVILFNVDPKDIRSDLRERQLTNAAKAIIRSGDPVMMDAIRIASPKFFGEFAKTLPPRRARPSFSATGNQDIPPEGIRNLKDRRARDRCHGARHQRSQGKGFCRHGK